MKSLLRPLWAEKWERRGNEEIGQGTGTNASGTLAEAEEPEKKRPQIPCYKVVGFFIDRETLEEVGEE